MVIFLSCLETSISIQDSDDSCKVEHETQHTRKLSIDSQVLKNSLIIITVITKINEFIIEYIMFIKHLNLFKNIL